MKIKEYEKMVGLNKYEIEVRDSILSNIHEDMKELSRMVNVSEYFTDYKGDMCLYSFRKWQWKLYGKLDILSDLNLISWETRKYYRKSIRNIGYRYRLKHNA